MKKLISATILLFFMVCGPVSLATTGKYIAPSFNEEIDAFSSSLLKEIATRYFDEKKRPVIKVTVFDFTDQNGDITVGSRYISNRLQIAFGSSSQFALMTPWDFQGPGFLVNAEEFEKKQHLRERIVGELKADVYVFGRIDVSGRAEAVCRFDVWGIKPPFDDFSNIEKFKELKETGPSLDNTTNVVDLEDPKKEKTGLEKDLLAPETWSLTFSSSGLDYFQHILIRASEQTSEGVDRRNLGEVIFLSQPVCDDLNISWQVRADGMVYDVRKDSDEGSLRNRTGQIMQGRVKDVETLKELSYMIKNFGLVIKDTTGTANTLEAYMIPKKSNFYFIPYREAGTGLRFMYLWGLRGKSKNPSPHETGKGWKLYVADEDYKNLMPVGTNTATATLQPISETEYGTKKPKAEYVSRFKFDVKPGLNIYVINYVYRRDHPEIFIRRLEIEGSEDESVRGIKRIKEVYRVYGEE